MRDEFDDRIRTDSPRKSRRRWIGFYRPNSEERSSASLCHLLAIFTGFIGPLIIWTTRKEDSRFVDFHGREALNFGLNMLILNLILATVFSIVAVVTCGFGALLFPLMFIPYIYGIVMHIGAMNAAGRGEWYQYSSVMRIISAPEGLEDEAPRRRYEDDEQDAPNRAGAHALPRSTRTDVEEPAESGSTLWIWIVGGVALLLLSGCCIGGGVLVVRDYRSKASSAPRFSSLPPPRAPAPIPPNNGGGFAPFGDDARKHPLPDDPVERAIVQMKSDDQFERRRGAEALADMAPEDARRAEVVKALQKELQDADQFPREAAARALAVWATKVDVQALLELLKIVRLADKTKVIEKLGASKDQRAIKPLVEALKEGAVRQAATEALKSIGSDVEVEMWPLLKDVSSFVRRAAFDILKAVGTKKSLPELEPLSRDRSPTTARQARDAIEAIKARNP